MATRKTKKAAAAAPVHSVATDVNGIPLVWRLHTRQPVVEILNDGFVTVRIDWSDKLSLRLPAFKGGIERAQALAARIVKQGWIVPSRWNRETFPIF